MRRFIIASGLACSLLASPTWAKRTANNVVVPCDPTRRQKLEEAGYSNAVISRGMLYVSGVATRRRDGETDIEPAIIRLYEAIGTILGQVGSDWDDVVDVTSYHTDIDAQLETFGRVSERYLKPPFPTSTVIGVDRLIVPEAFAEVKVVAELPDDAKSRCEPVIANVDHKRN